MFEIFFNSFFIAFSGALMPGSLLTYTIDKSIKCGGSIAYKKTGLFREGAFTGFMISAGHAILELIMVILLFAGLNKILTLDISRIIIGFAGGSVLIFFALMMIRDVIAGKINIDFNIDDGKDGKDDKKNNFKGNTGGILFINGAFISALNPYFIVWWTAVGLTFIVSSYARFGFLGIAVFYFGHIFADILWYTFISAVISKAKKIFNQKIYRTVIIILAVFLIFIALSFFLSSFNLLNN